MKIDIKGIFKPALPLIIICLAVSSVLAVTNAFTKDRIAELALQNKNDAMGRIYSDTQFTKLDTTGCECYAAENKGYVITVASKGYGGEISVMVGVNTDGTVKAVEILDASSETVGLGQNAAKPEFYTAFNGKVAGITVVKNGAVGNQINALTGATITSNAVADAVNQALEIAKSLNTSPNEGGAAQ